MGVTDEHVHDSKLLPQLVDEVIKSNGSVLDKLLADGAYDFMIFSDFCQKMGFYLVSR